MPRHAHTTATPHHTRSLRQVKYNLVVYDLEQLSREIDEIMFKMSQDKQYEGLTEPAVSQYDDVLASTMAGVRKAAEVESIFPLCMIYCVHASSADVADSQFTEKDAGCHKILVVCMYICMYVCMYICTYVCMYIYIYI